MEEIYQITSALKFRPSASTWPSSPTRASAASPLARCIRPRTPEALAGGPVGKILEGDEIEITVDRVKLEGTVNFIVNGSAEEGSRVLARVPCRMTWCRSRASRREPPLAALQDVSGGTWAAACSMRTPSREAAMNPPTSYRYLLSLRSA